ncbi:MAG: capsule biosynthesis protein [Phyllobacteriaceae bacterium]|nr:capsule biosynthesis protein [Phyllobacteriaceae bacterium]
MATREDVKTTIERSSETTTATSFEARVAASRPLALAKPLTALMRMLKRDAPRAAERAKPRTRGFRLPKPPSYGQTFVLFVVLPSLASFFYLIFLASDQYAAEARFAIRTGQLSSTLEDDPPTTVTPSPLSGIPTIANQNAYVVANYIRSPAIFADLGPSVDPRRIYGRPEADFWARLPANATREQLEDYWKGMVRTNVDGPSGVVSVTVRAFRPADARELADAIVAASEKLVNGLSQRAREDAMASAEAEVRRTEGLVRGSLEEMQAYRDKVGYINPLTATASASQLLLEAMGEKIRLESDYFVSLRAMSADAPTVIAQKTRLDALDKQISELKGRLTGSTGDKESIAGTLARYEELELKRVFAEKLYDLASRSLERSRQRAEQQHLYLSVFAPPEVPEEARYPQRLRLGILIPIALIILWGIAALTVATIEDHTF